LMSRRFNTEELMKISDDPYLGIPKLNTYNPQSSPLALDSQGEDSAAEAEVAGSLESKAYTPSDPNENANLGGSKRNKRNLTKKKKSRKNRRTRR